MPLTQHLSKRVQFSASHYYHRPEWDETQNKAIFGLCSNVNGHGHNYEVIVTVRKTQEPAVDKTTGMIINFDILDPLLNKHVVSVYDHKLINKEVLGFDHKIPTLENITLDLHHRLLKPLHEIDLELVSVKVYERKDLWVEWMTIKNNTLKLTKQYQFSAAHTLFNPELSSEENQKIFGACANLHGHTYTLEISVEGHTDEKTGMLIPLPQLDALVQKHLLDKVDHRNLDVDVDFIQGSRSTVEVLSQLFFKELNPHMPLNTQLAGIKLFECPENCAETVAN